MADEAQRKALSHKTRLQNEDGDALTIDPPTCSLHSSVNDPNMFSCLDLIENNRLCQRP